MNLGSAIPPVEQEAAFESGGFGRDLRAILRPEERWHWLFHVLVILVALSYWVGSRWELPEASWAELVMYRPQGDSQVYPVITALSRLNFGDPTDAFHYGQDVGGFHTVILLPYAAAFALFGARGYMVADAALSWGYFVAILLLLRRVNFSVLASLLAGSALATGSLQNITSRVCPAVLSLSGMDAIRFSESTIPDLVSLQIFTKRIPRPMITEILVVLLLYSLFRLWQQRRVQGTTFGIAIGGLWVVVMQGDPYSFAVLGLVLAAAMIRSTAMQAWRVPWSCCLGVGIGGLLGGAYFLFQLANQDPEWATRFGLVPYPRTGWMPLPGFAPMFRVIVAGLLGGIVWIVAGACKRRLGVLTSEREGLLADRVIAVAQFCVMVVVAAWMAQPIQLLLLGQSAQIYHYLLATLPGFYAYAVLVLVGQAFVLSARFGQLHGVGSRQIPSWVGCLALTACLTAELLFGVEPSLDSIYSLGTARAEVSVWTRVGSQYRPGFRGLDQAFDQVPELKRARSFATFNHEINFLLTAFHDKRAFLPDNGFTTLPDAELERRLFEVCKICQIPPEQFVGFIQNRQVLNFWLGCAKYWFTPEYTYAPRDDYPPGALRELAMMRRQAGFAVALPLTEVKRIDKAYRERLFAHSDLAEYPDAIVLTVLASKSGVRPAVGLYREVYRNEVFQVYSKAVGSGYYSAAEANGLDAP